jgi:hypothetical protein
MWVRKSEWKSLERRVSSLEEIVSKIQDQHQYNPDEAAKCLEEAINRFATTHDSALKSALRQKNSYLK